MKLAYLLTSEENFSVQPLSMSSSTTVDMSFLSGEVFSAIVSSGIQRKRPLNHLKFVKVNGTAYYCGMFVVLAVPYDVPLLGRINVIYVQDMVCYLLETKFHAEFDNHSSAYAIENERKHGIAIYQIENPLNFYLYCEEQKICCFEELCLPS
jgi:hypothetical protein